MGPSGFLVVPVLSVVAGTASSDLSDHALRLPPTVLSHKRPANVSVSPDRLPGVQPATRKRGPDGSRLSISGCAETVRINLESTISVYNADRDLLQDLKDGIAAQVAVGPNCDGSAIGACFICRTFAPSATSARRGTCLRRHACFTCFSLNHVKSACKVKSTILLARGSICYGCGLPGGGTGGHVDFAGRTVEFGSSCGSYAHNVLLPLCWFAFADVAIMASAENPARTIRSDQGFYDFLFSCPVDSRVPNIIRFAVWLLRYYFRLIV